MISQAFIVVALAAVAFAHYVPEPVHHAPKPYAFGYSIKDKHGEQHREESGTGGHAVKGSYGFTDARGVHREVEYVADGTGFRANVKTNEPGTANQSPAAVHLVSNAPHPYGPGQGFLLTPGAGFGGLGYAGAGLGFAAPGPVAGLGFAAPGPVAGLGSAAPSPVAGPSPVAAALGGAGLAGFGIGGNGLANVLLSGLDYARYGY